MDRNASHTHTPVILTGKVVANYDEKAKGMVQVALHGYAEEGNVTDWIRVASPAAGKNGGMYWLPEVGDEVVVALIDANIQNAIVIGSLWNDANTRPESAVTEENTVKTLITKSGVSLTFSDEEGKEAITLTTPAGITVQLSDDTGEILLKDKDGNNKINLNTKNGEAAVTAKKKLTLSANEIEISAAAKCTVNGADVLIDAKSSIKLNAGGLTEIKGSMVKLNG